MHSSRWVIGLAMAVPLGALAETSPHTVTGNFGFVSDYVSRGIEQTWGDPALQGGIDYSHASGFYAGTWASSVNASYIANGTVEVDFYTGFRTPLSETLNADVGVAYYWYPSTDYSKFMLNDANYPAQNYCGAADVCNAGFPDNDYDTVEVYAALSYGPVSGKVLYALTDYYGYDDKTAPISAWRSGITGGVDAGEGTEGSVYVDLNGNFPVSKTLTAVVHAGYQYVAHSQNLSYYDFKLGLNCAFGQGWTAGVAWIDTVDAEIYDNYPAVTGSGEERSVTEGRAIASITRTF